MDSPVQLVIRTFATGGDAVGHPTGGELPGTWFVADALPGERVLAEPIKTAKKHVVGRVLEVLEPASERVTPPCPLEGICGGCGWQHIQASAQHELKRVIVKDALRGLGVEPVLGPSPGGDGLAYRRRARLHYRRMGDELALGFFRRRSDEVVDVPRCPVLVPALAHAVGRLRRVAHVLPESGEVLGLAEGKRAILGLPGVRPIPEVLDALAPALDKVLVGIEVRGGRGRGHIGEPRLAIDGGAGLPPTEATPFVFAQARGDANRMLVRHVLARAKPHGKRVLELYAGTGNFTRALAKSASRVWTCDDDREAVGLLRRMAEQEALPINAKHGDVAALLPRIANGETRYEIVVADPPRSGLGQTAARALAKVATERIVLVACDAATLARDLAVLTERGWAIEEVAVFDLMPMTPEVEIVATLRTKS